MTLDKAPSILLIYAESVASAACTFPRALSSRVLPTGVVNPARILPGYDPSPVRLAEASDVRRRLIGLPPSALVPYRSKAKPKSSRIFSSKSPDMTSLSRPKLPLRLRQSDSIGRDRDSHWPIDVQGGRYSMTSI